MNIDPTGFPAVKQFLHAPSRKHPVSIRLAERPIMINCEASVVFSNPGYCPICCQDTVFVATDEWFRDFYLCNRCGSLPRQRAVVEVLNSIKPNWRDLTVHESSPCINFFAEQCSGYTKSQYFEDVPFGSTKNGQRSENLEQLTFPNAAFDVFLTQDVLEHVFRPDLALQEITRVLKPGGVHVFTTPKHKTLLKSYQRARQTTPGEIEYLLPAEYHGNPIGDGRSLVTWDYGADFDDLLARWSGYLTSNYVIRDRTRGIDGEFLEVFVMRKESTSRVPRSLAKKAGAPVWNIESVGESNSAWEHRAFEAPSDKELVVSGWAIDPECENVAGGVQVLIDDVSYSALYGGSRPDVARFFGAAAYLDSGYILRLPAGEFALGTHALSVHVLSSDLRGYWEAGPYTLDVTLSGGSEPPLGFSSGAGKKY